MAAPAKKAGDIKVSFIVARRPDGKTVITFPSKGRMVEFPIDESSDPALDLHARLKKNKGQDDRGKLLYTDSALFVRPKTNRRLHFQ